MRLIEFLYYYLIAIPFLLFNILPLYWGLTDTKLFLLNYIFIIPLDIFVFLVIREYSGEEEEDKEANHEKGKIL
jgi:hypothetical protein